MNAPRKQAAMANGENLHDSHAASSLAPRTTAVDDLFECETLLHLAEPERLPLGWELCDFPNRLVLSTAFHVTTITLANPGRLGFCSRLEGRPLQARRVVSLLLLLQLCVWGRGVQKQTLSTNLLQYSCLRKRAGHAFTVSLPCIASTKPAVGLLF